MVLGGYKGREEEKEGGNNRQKKTLEKTFKPIGLVLLVDKDTNDQVITKQSFAQLANRLVEKPVEKV